MKLITDIRKPRSWTLPYEVYEWIAANIPDTVAFNGSAVFASDEDYLLFKMKFASDWQWEEKQREPVFHGMDIVTGSISAAQIKAGSISASKITGLY